MQERADIPPDFPPDFPIIPPEWIEASAGPYTGWLSPEGLLYQCNPWCHAELAAELTRAGRRACPDLRFHSAGDLLAALGWILVDRKSKSDRQGGGGGLYVLRHNQPNDRQAGRGLAALVRGARRAHRAGRALTSQSKSAA